MFTSLPNDAKGILDWPWDRIEPYYKNLEQRALSEAGLEHWLANWSRIAELVDEISNRLYVATTVDTADQKAEDLYHRFLADIFPKYEEHQQRLKQKLVTSGLAPQGFEVPLRKMRQEADLFRTANLPLLVGEKKLSEQYDKIAGAQAVQWRGREQTLAQMETVQLSSDRAEREKAWRLASERQLADRAEIDGLWKKMLGLRIELAKNADFNDYRSFRWKQLGRFDYTPEDCDSFHRAIEQVAVPAASRIYRRRAERLGLKAPRPWDLQVDVLGRPALQPFAEVSELVARAAAMFDKVDPVLGGHFHLMAGQGLLDLENRKDKAPGGYCTNFAAARVPFVFANAVGMHGDVQTLLHEGGHAFHLFESRHLPYLQQLEVPMEFAEVASMAMELLAAPYLDSPGGFYSPGDSKRARLEHLEGQIAFWPYMAVVDAFQHWAYLNPDKAMEPANCDSQWSGLWRRFMPGVDWTGLEEAVATGWQRKQHIFSDPFYYVEYGLAQLGAVQVWGRALEDQSRAVAGYRKALALGGTAPLPELYRTAGAAFAFDAGPLQAAVGLLERTIEELDSEKQI